MLGDTPGHGLRERLRAAWPRWRVLGGELLSSFALFGVMAAVALLLAPWYARMLGAEEWGVAALGLTLHGILFTLEQILGPLLLRDVGAATPAERPVLLRRHRRRFLGGGLLLSLLAAIGLYAHGTNEVLWLILPWFLLQVGNSAEVGYWHASGALHRANVRSAAFHCLKHGLAVFGVLFVAPQAGVLLAGLLLGSGIEYFTNRFANRRVVATAAAAEAGMAASAGLGMSMFAVASLCSVLSGQVDRMVLSSALSLADYGRYYLVGSVLLSVLHLQLPLQRSFLPRIAAADDPWSVARGMLRAGLLLIGLPCVVAMLLAEPALRIWSGDAVLAEKGAPVLQAMLLAAILMVAYAPVGAVLLSRRRYGRLLAINGGTLSLQFLVLLLASGPFGMLAGGLAWLAGASLQFAALLRGWRREHWLR